MYKVFAYLWLCRSFNEDDLSTGVHFCSQCYMLDLSWFVVQNFDVLCFQSPMISCLVCSRSNNCEQRFFEYRSSSYNKRFWNRGICSGSVFFMISVIFTFAWAFARVMNDLHVRQSASSCNQLGTYDTVSSWWSVMLIGRLFQISYFTSSALMTCFTATGLDSTNSFQSITDSTSPLIDFGAATACSTAPSILPWIPRLPSLSAIDWLTKCCSTVFRRLFPCYLRTTEDN